jgi:hypothetical protein
MWVRVPPPAPRHRLDPGAATESERPRPIPIQTSILSPPAAPGMVRFLMTAFYLFAFTYAGTGPGEAAR